MSTADQLEQGPTDNKHPVASPGKEFHGQHDLDFASVARAKHPPHGEPGHPGSPWSLSKNHD